jgi:hypothetical protein
MTTGMLGEGTLCVVLDELQAYLQCTDGIHIDMNHLKKGEVK